MFSLKQHRKDRCLWVTHFKRIIRFQRSCSTLILSPTRELTLQVSKELTAFSAKRNLMVCPILGGESMDRQLKQLKKNFQVVVGSPGRIIDHMKRKSLDLSQLQYMVLDEADEMLNKGFIEDIEFILGHTPTQKRTVLVSATLDKPLKQLANRYMNDPVSIESSSTSKTVTMYCNATTKLKKLKK